MPETSETKRAPSGKNVHAAKKKAAKTLHPIALHVIQAYEAVYKLSFLLNKKKCLMGSPKSGFALNCAAIRRLQSITLPEKNILDQLPTPLFESTADEHLNALLNQMLGHSVLELLAEPIRRYLSQLLPIIKPIDGKDDSPENRARIILVFKSPIDNSSTPGGSKASSKITPYQLLQQVQKNTALLRQRLMMELDTLQQYRYEWITGEDCYHALTATGGWEVKGRIQTAREIYQSLRGMIMLKDRDYTDEFHPKITLDRAIENMQAWGPGTPPRLFRVKDDAHGGKTIVLNEKLKEQLSILKEATDHALGYTFGFPKAEERVKGLEEKLKEHFPPKEGEEGEATSEGEPPAGDRRSSALSYDEILQYYAEKKEESAHKYLAALYFEIKSSTYLERRVLTIEQAQDLRGVFTTLHMDLSQAVDLYMVESKKIVQLVKKISKKIGVEANSKELILIAQPGELTQSMLYNKAVEHWTQTYVLILKKYLLIDDAHKKKILQSESSLKSLAAMEASKAITYLEQLESLVQAQKKGYITEEQKERYLDPDQTDEHKLQSILAFFGAIEKFNLASRCESISKGFQEHLTSFQEIVAKDSSKQRAFKDPIKEMETLASSSESKLLIPELLNAEIFDMEPVQVYLFMERVLVCLEMKQDYIKFQSHAEEALKELNTKLSGGVDVPKFSKIFFMPESSGQASLLGLLNQINGTKEKSAKNVFHKNDNSVIRECVLKSFELKDPLNGENAVNAENAPDLLGLEYCVNIMICFQHSFMIAARKVFALDAETKRSENQSNELGVKADRVQEMRNQCELILDKQVPIQFALKQLEEIWQTLESDKIVAKEAKMIAGLQQKLDGNVAGGSSLYKRLSNNPDNVEIMADYRQKAQEAYATYQKNLQNIAARLRALNQKNAIPKNILEYQRQILAMERAIYQAAEELKEGSSRQVEMLTTQIKEKQKRIFKYKKIVEKYKKANPDVELPT